jgi:hypothetical protein
MPGALGRIGELREAGLIRCVRRGQSVYCSIEFGPLDEIGRFLVRT